MHSISTVVTRGYGSFGDVNLLPTLGYGSSDEASIPVDCWTAPHRRTDYTAEQRVTDWAAETRRTDYEVERRPTDWTAPQRRTDWEVDG